MRCSGAGVRLSGRALRVQRTTHDATPAGGGPRAASHLHHLGNRDRGSRHALGRPASYGRHGGRGTCRRRNERSRRSRRPPRRALRAGKGSRHRPQRRPGVAAAQRQRTCPPRPLRLGSRVHHHRGVVLYRRPQPRPGPEVSERIRDVRRPLPGRPHRDAGVGQPLHARLSAPQLARSTRGSTSGTGFLRSSPRPVLRLAGPGPRRPRLRGSR